MANELTIVDKQNLSPQEIEELDAQIDSIIERHKNNRAEINRLVLEGTTALTAGDKLSQDMNSQKRLKRFWKRFSGKNNQTQNKINAGIFKAQYAAQETLQKLAEQNLLSFELIAVVNNRLNASMLEVNDEIIGIKSAMVEFFKRSRAEIIRLETRLEKVEQNVNLLNWQNSIEYQMYDGVEYQELDDATKIVCLARDFFDITKGEWHTSDLLLLKTAMATIGLNPKSKISYENFIRQVAANPQLFLYLLGENFQLATEDETIFFSFNKMNRLATEEKYLVQVTQKSLAKNGINLTNEEIVYQLTEDFVAQEADFHLSAEVSNYELILELLYNLAQVQYAKEQIRFQEKLQEKLTLAKKLFLKREIKEALPLLKELEQSGDLQARYMLANIYHYGWEVAKDEDYAKSLIKKNIYAGDVCSLNFSLEMNTYFFQGNARNWMRKLSDLADSGDVFAQYEYGRLALGCDDEKNGYKYSKMASVQKYWWASYYVARHYAANSKDKDYVKAVEFYKDAIENISDETYKAIFMHNIADIYWDGGYGVTSNIGIALEWYKKAHEKGDHTCDYDIGECYVKLGGFDNKMESIKWFRLGAERGNKECIDKLSAGYGVIAGCYEEGNGVEKNYVKAIEYYKYSIEAGWNDGVCEICIGYIYLTGGYGITASLSTAREWLKKAADKGQDDAKKWLKDF